MEPPGSVMTEPLERLFKHVTVQNQSGFSQTHAKIQRINSPRAIWLWQEFDKNKIFLVNSFTKHTNSSLGFSVAT